MTKQINLELSIDEAIEKRKELLKEADEFAKTLN